MEVKNDDVPFAMQGDHSGAKGPQKSAHPLSSNHDGRPEIKLSKTN